MSKVGLEGDWVDIAQKAEETPGGTRVKSRAFRPYSPKLRTKTWQALVLRLRTRYQVMLFSSIFYCEASLWTQKQTSSLQASPSEFISY